ncbi:MAG: hypothetical protein IT184_03705 [Acidobacteria bacterium]|nr:hypothetical protein [Acidobacteriota bacterium]
MKTRYLGRSRIESARTCHAVTSVSASRIAGTVDGTLPPYPGSPATGVSGTFDLPFDHRTLCG